MSVVSEFSKGLKAAVAKAAEGTVLVDARRRLPASGIAFTADLILTADHVVTRETDLSVTGSDGKSYPASIAGRDPGSDLAVLRLPESVLSPASLSRHSAAVGQLVLAVGHPTESGVQASWGIVTSVGGPTRTGRGGLLEKYFQSETTPYPGFSGGPMVNTEGAVLGLNTSGLTPGSSITIAAEVAWRVGEALAKNGTIRCGNLGIRTQAVELPEAASSGSKSKAGRERGLLVLWIEEGGPAASAGMLVGDILVGIGDHPVSDPDDIFPTLGSDAVGKTLTVEVMRGEKPHSIRVTVGERQ
jgi:S1-C subfamily serine protease